MQIDGHHTGTYVCARAAGFPHGAAEIIAYAAQYVDDATNAGPICFADSEYMYSRIASAYKMLDANNFSDVMDNLSWLPFHFLPGNCGLPAEPDSGNGELDKLLCRPCSPVALDMLRAAASDIGKPRGLHRLGIAMHVFADTFAHQGFAGTLCRANTAKGVTSGDKELDEKIRSCSKEDVFHQILTGGAALWDCLSRTAQMAIKEKKWVVEFFVDFFKKEPIGHAAVDTFPDQPWLCWSYRDWRGCVVSRNNPRTFLDAFDAMTRVMQAWRAGDGGMDLTRQPGLDPGQRGEIARMIASHTDPDGAVRHRNWLKAIAAGEFSFGKEVLEYKEKGEGSWKHLALGTTRDTDTGLEKFPYTPGFLTSHWKLFHDALQVHRADVLHEILPRYGICAG